MRILASDRVNNWYRTFITSCDTQGHCTIFHTVRFNNLYGKHKVNGARRKQGNSRSTKISITPRTTVGAHAPKTNLEKLIPKLVHPDIVPSSRCVLSATKVTKLKLYLCNSCCTTHISESYQNDKINEDIPSRIEI